MGIGTLAQNHRVIRGICLNDRGEALESTVVFSALDTTTTKSDGSFSLKVNVGKAQIYFRRMGYEQSMVEVPAASNQVQVSLYSEITPLDEVTVTAERQRPRVESVDIQEISPKLVQEINPIDLKEVVNKSPGLSLIDGQVSLRGGAGWSYGAGTRVNLILDGLPLLSADASDIKWDYLPTAIVSKILVKNGASSSFSGSGGLNGSIAVSTLWPTKKTQVEAYSMGGVYSRPENLNGNWWEASSHFQKNLGFTYGTAKESKQTLVHVDYFKNDEYRKDAYNERAKIFFKHRQRFGRNQNVLGGISGGFMHQTGQQFVIWKSDTAAYQSREDALADLRNFRFHIDPSLVVLKENGRHEFRGRTFVTLNRGEDFPSDSENHQFRYIYTLNKKAQSLFLGFHSQYSQVFSEPYGNHFSLTMAPFGGYKLTKEKWEIGGGVRAEYFSIDQEGAFLPLMNLEGKIRPWKGGLIQAGMGSGMRYPSVAEKYVKARAAGLIIYPNDSLKTEISQTYEVGISQTFGSKDDFMVTKLNFFRMDYENMIQFEFGTYGPQVPPDFGLGIAAVNVGKARISGLEVSVLNQRKIGKMKLRVIGGYTYINPLDLSDPDTSLVLKYRSNHLGKLDASIFNNKWNVGLSVSYQSFHERIDRIFLENIPGVRNYRENNPEGQTLLGIRFGYEFSSSFALQIQISNLLNQNYMIRPGLPAAPRLSSLRLSYRI